MAGGGGPPGTVARAGADSRGFAVLDAASVPLGPAPAPTSANLRAIRDAFRDWGVTMVVVPDDAGLATYQTGRGSAYGSALFAAVLGSAPVRQDGAWVWSDITVAPPPVSISSMAFDACLALGHARASAEADVARCVVASSPGGADTHG